ncbi:unnamed protein product [Camellia sinensis]
MSSKGEHLTVPLSVLLNRELANEKIERPEISHGQACQSKKGEHFTFVKTECQRVVAGDDVSTYSVFAKEGKKKVEGEQKWRVPPFGRKEGREGRGGCPFLSNPPKLIQPRWVREDREREGEERKKVQWIFEAQTSGTTVTFMIIEGWVLTVASVGDSRCILESAEGEIYYLSADHRLECSVEERERITASGGEVGRLNTGGGTEIGPLRCWPGGLGLSRSIGDLDVGEFIVPVPYAKQVKV